MFIWWVVFHLKGLGWSGVQVGGHVASPWVRLHSKLSVPQIPVQKEADQTHIPIQSFCLNPHRGNISGPPLSSAATVYKCTNAPRQAISSQPTQNHTLIQMHTHRSTHHGYTHTPHRNPPVKARSNQRTFNILPSSKSRRCSGSTSRSAAAENTIAGTERVTYTESSQF